MPKVLIHNGRFRKQDVQNIICDLVFPMKTSQQGTYITVDGKSAGLYEGRARIFVANDKCFEIIGQPNHSVNEHDGSLQVEEIMQFVQPEETDDEVIERIRKRFKILEDMTNAAVDGIVRGLIVTGPPGVGKSFGIEKIISDAETAAIIVGSNAKYGIEKGTASPIGLYKLLYEYHNQGSVLVLDDSDTILYDEDSLNLLKAVLDSGKKRRVSWRKESRVLENESIPNTFEFQGSVIFITNLRLENTRGKTGDHMAALISRCHYLDLTINTVRDKFLRCKQIINDGMLSGYGFTKDDQDELVEFLDDNKNKFRELSLRMVSKIADLKRMDKKRWKEYAKNTCMHH
jgi:hypothetical protein